MLSHILIAWVSFGMAGVALYSGFGLGTALLPFFSFFFPLELAVASTAFVHGTNNLLKAVMFGKHAEVALLLRFGLPAVIAALLGAVSLHYIVQIDVTFYYRVGALQAIVTPVKVLLAFLMAAFAVFELLPSLSSMIITKKYLIAGGVLSGFLGGLSGHEGALRSAFLSKVDISTKTFIGTNAVIGLMVDLSRVSMYVFLFLVVRDHKDIVQQPWSLVVVSFIAAIAGVILSRRFLHTVNMHVVQTTIGVLLILLAIGMAVGVL